MCYGPRIDEDRKSLRVDSAWRPTETGVGSFDDTTQSMIEAYNSMLEALIAGLAGAFARTWTEVNGQLESQGKVRALQKLAMDISEATKEA